jgi:hypothetical protein
VDARCADNPLLTDPGPTTREGRKQAHWGRVSAQNEQIGVILRLLSPLPLLFFSLRPVACPVCA